MDAPVRDSASRHGSEDHERLGAGEHRRWQVAVGRLVGEVLLTGKETYEWSPHPRSWVADGSYENRVAGFEGIEERRLGAGRVELKCHLAPGAVPRATPGVVPRAVLGLLFELHKGSKVRRQPDPHDDQIGARRGPRDRSGLRIWGRSWLGSGRLLRHGRVCTSTESTAGRSRTMGAQLSPALAEAYTCPPVVPK